MTAANTAAFVAMKQKICVYLLLKTRLILKLKTNDEMQWLAQGKRPEVDVKTTDAKEVEPRLHCVNRGFKFESDEGGTSMPSSKTYLLQYFLI